MPEAQVKLTVRVKSRAKDIGGKAQAQKNWLLAANGCGWVRVGGGNEFIF